MGAPQSQAQHCAEKKNLLPLPGIKNMKKTQYFLISGGTLNILSQPECVSVQAPYLALQNPRNIQLRHNGACSQ
jgi:hypothetical protein